MDLSQILTPERVLRAIVAVVSVYFSFRAALRKLHDKNKEQDRRLASLERFKVEAEQNVSTLNSFHKLNHPGQDPKATFRGNGDAGNN